MITLVVSTSPEQSTAPRKNDVWHLTVDEPHLHLPKSLSIRPARSGSRKIISFDYNPESPRSELIPAPVSFSSFISYNEFHGDNYVHSGITANAVAYVNTIDLFLVHCEKITAICFTIVVSIASEKVVQFQKLAHFQ